VKFIKEMRVYHYLKNFLILLPLIFSGKLFSKNYLIYDLIGIISFCFMSSVVYILNDIKDVDKDRKHEKKKNRPIASGEISIPNAKILAIILFVLSVLLIQIFIIIYKSKTGVFNWKCIVVLMSYFLVNVLYSIVGLKRIPILDIILLVLGFYLRVLMGSVLTGIKISSWLYLVVISGSFYMGFTKRRNEFIQNRDSTREVLLLYNENFLDRNMYSCMTLSIIFFSLWCLEKNNSDPKFNFIMLVPIFMIICFKYSMDVESENSDGDPMNVILNDKILICLVAIFAILIIILLYI